MAELSKIPENIKMAILNALGTPWKERYTNDLMMQCDGIIDCPNCKAAENSLEFQALPYSDLIAYRCRNCGINGVFVDVPEPLNLVKIAEMIGEVFRDWLSCLSKFFLSRTRMEQIPAAKTETKNRKPSKGGSGTAAPDASGIDCKNPIAEEVDAAAADSADMESNIKKEIASHNQKLAENDQHLLIIPPCDENDRKSNWIPWKVGRWYQCKNPKVIAKILIVDPKLEFCVRGEIYGSKTIWTNYDSAAITMADKIASITWNRDGSYYGNLTFDAWDLTIIEIVLQQ